MFATPMVMAQADQAETNSTNDISTPENLTPAPVPTPPIVPGQPPIPPTTPSPNTNSDKSTNPYKEGRSPKDELEGLPGGGGSTSGGATNTVKDPKVLVSPPAQNAGVTSNHVSEMNSQAKADLEVLDFVLAGNVESREPQNIVEAFGKENTRGFAFARLRVNTASDVTFVWYRNDTPVARYKSSIHPAKKWRTYSSVTLRPGQWKVQLLDKDQVVAEKTFTIE